MRNTNGCQHNDWHLLIKVLIIQEFLWNCNHEITAKTDTALWLENNTYDWIVDLMADMIWIDKRWHILFCRNPNSVPFWWPLWKVTWKKFITFCLLELTLIRRDGRCIYVTHYQMCSLIRWYGRFMPGILKLWSWCWRMEQTLIFAVNM